MKLRTPFCFVVLTLASRCAHAQQTDVTPAPTPRPVPSLEPALGKTDDFAAWTIVLHKVPGLHEQSAEAVVRLAASAASPESLVSITKTGPVRYSLRKLKTGQQEEVWYEHSNRITMESGWKIPMFEISTFSAKQPLGPDFPEMSWVSARNFSGIQRYQDTDYLVFETQVEESNAATAKEHGYKPTKTFNRAYLNADTRLPWLLQIGDTLHRYVFQAPPTGPVEVPPAFQAMFDTFEKKKAASLRKPVAP